jgi:hypothetical protein
MFDVQSVHCSGQAEFHTSTASGLLSPWSLDLAACLWVGQQQEASSQ